MISAPPLTQAPAAAGFRRCFQFPPDSSVHGGHLTGGTGRQCTLYEVMGLWAGATGGEIMAAYQRLALERDLDVASTAGDDFIRLHDAYAMLSDLDTRARNDRDVVTQAYAQPPASKSSPHDF
jgi:hypothetical protein